MREEGNLEYRNKFVLNQRGGSLDINNSTDRESVQLSQYSGSNITMSNVVNSELATNNKQTTVIFDEFKTVGNSSSEYIAKDSVTRVGENSYTFKGVSNQDQIDKFNEWKTLYRTIAETNAKFELNRGCISYPYSGTPPQKASTPEGTRTDNPDILLSNRLATNNTFHGYTQVPVVKSTGDDVTAYVPVPDKGNTVPAQSTTATELNVVEAFGQDTGTQAPGTIKYGPSVSSSTQDGTWTREQSKAAITEQILKLQEQLNAIEQSMGNGGDEIESINRHKIQNIGATFNDYPSIRIDPEGKSMATEMGVSTSSTFKHYDFVPHCEDVDNGSNFPCGNYSLNVGNRYNVLAGSGGIQIKTSGPLAINGANVKLGGTHVDISGAAGLALQSESHIDVVSQKIHLRSPRQVLVDSSLGVSNNCIVGGSHFVEGETYCNHITAPLEVQQTYNTRVFGAPVAGAVIGYVEVAGTQYPVQGVATPDSIELMDHSHHFPNIPLTLMLSNEELRQAAIVNGINRAGAKATPTHVVHEAKSAMSIL